MDIISSVFAKLHYKQLSSHLVNYCRLYTHPYSTWKGASVNRSSASEIVTLHLIYYAVIVFCIVSAGLVDFTIYAVPLLVLIDAALVIIPTSIFVIPFVTLSKVFKKRNKWHSLFRVLLVIKLQFILPLLAVVLLAKSTGNEGLYVGIYNLIWLLLIAYVVVPPFTIDLKGRQRLVWILSNYVFVNLFLLGFVWLSLKSDTFSKLGDDVAIYTPAYEFSKFNENVDDVYENVEDGKFMVYLARDKDGNWHTSNLQYVTSLLLAYYKGKLWNDSLALATVKFDSLPKFERNQRYREVAAIYLEKEYVLNLQRADSLREVFTEMFHNDLRQAEVAKDSAKFDSNRKYFAAMHEYLTAYSMSYINNDSISAIWNNRRSTISLEGNVVAFMFDRDARWLTQLKGRIIEQKEVIDMRDVYCFGLVYFLFYPVYLIFEFIP